MPHPRRGQTWARARAPPRFRAVGAGNMAAMITFFVILAVLMVLVVAAGQWSAGPGRRVFYDRGVVVGRRRGVVEEEVVDDEPYPVARSRRVVRRPRGRRSVADRQTFNLCAGSSILPAPTIGEPTTGRRVPGCRCAAERLFRVPSDLDYLELRIEAAEVVHIGRHHSLPCATGTDDDMGIDHIGCAGGRQQPPDVRGVHPVEGNDVRVRLADQAGEPDLALGPADRLGQRSRWHGEPSPDLGGSGEEHDNRAIAPVDGDQAAGVEGHS